MEQDIEDGAGAPEAETPRGVVSPESAARSQAMVRPILRAYFRVFHGARYRGMENIPSSGPVLIAPNHVSYYDPLLIGIPLRRAMVAMAREPLFRVPALGALIGWLGAFPVHATLDSHAYKQSLQLLKKGVALLVFPEGKRAVTRDIGPFGAGVARLALRTGAAIVPATITGAFEAFPRFHRFPRPRWRITVKFHPPVYPPKVNLRGEALRQAIEDLNEAIARPIRRRYAAHVRLEERLGRKAPRVPPGFVMD
ncbi:MAG: lysophospholipid acyltransferase family protein [Candidatus Sumerlaeota bacterium]|nr:lysophospholipid acyltransferase family protein [Candidatus Sumerlaeota bacterium]